MSLSERQAAHELGIPLDRLREAVNKGQLACEGPRRKRRFTIAELQRWWSIHRSRPWMRKSPA